MTFQSYLCWDTGQVRQVLNTDAEYASRHIFLAVHSEYPLRAISSRPGGGIGRGDASWTMQPQEFIQDFLSQGTPHMQVAVLGDSGAGKSHLISWIKYNLPATADRYTIAIPRTGVSLRGVLELIIDTLPEAERQPYIDDLNRSGNQHSSHQNLQERLLSEIALAIQSDQVKGDANPDLENALIDKLPNLFHDPTLRHHLSQSGGIVEQLATQVLSASKDYLPAEERREFSREDLPLSGVQTAKMSADAGDTCLFLNSNPEAQGLAVEIINRNLNRAIVQVLNFSGDRIIRLFQEVRRHLRTQGKELILLIEDLARLQGLDMSLLEALFEVGNEDNGLCRLRWAAAVTSGYYTRLPNTVQTRMNYVLQMDYPTDGENGSISTDDIVAFAAKYLNASRVDEADLSAWAELPEDQRGDPLNRCESCPHKSVCHAAFGSHDGVGLYPFNSNSLMNMLRRQDDQLHRRFNPRVLVKDVMAEVLGTYGEDLRDGRFPPQLLLNQMGGAQLRPVVQDQLRRQNPQQADRQLAILELWGNGGSQIADLAEDLYTAFGTTKPQLQQHQRPELPVGPEVPGRVEPDPPQDIDPVVAAIRTWGNGDSMQDRVTNLLRPMIFDSIVGHIDWDTEGLVQSYFAGSAHRIFDKSFSIGFARQMTQRRSRPVSLTIPSSDGQQEFTEAAMALEGLYLFSRHGNWEFDDERDLFLVYANCLEQWSREALKQIESFRSMQGRWDISKPAVEMLTIGAALAGKAPRQRTDDIGWLNALFTDWPAELPDRTREWQGLYTAFANELTPLRDAVRASASGSKGGQRGQFIDPTALLPAIRRVRRNWNLSTPPPDEVQSFQSQFGRFARLHNRIQTGLSTVAAVEWHDATDWAKEWRGNLGEDIKGRQAIGEIRELMDLALKSGLPFNPNTRRLMDSALIELESAQLNSSLEQALRLLERDDPLKLLHTLGRRRGNYVGVAVKRLILALAQLLSQLENAAANRASSSGAIESELAENQARIEKALGQLASGLKVMEGSYGQPD